MYWGGLRTGALAFWDLLADAQARELVEIRRLARRVSGDTGRVVLSWHNASLAAAGGWGFEGLSGQFPSMSAYNDFARSVRQSAGEIRRGLDERALGGLFEMRAKRIYAPKAAQALERLRSLREMGRISGSDWLEMSRRAGVLLDPAEVEQIDSGRKTEWSGALAPHQRVGLDMVLAWYDHSKKTWAEGLCLLLALAMRGREAIESGLAPSFVLPWIDKFFISSRRRADQGYLERLFGLLAGRVEAPLVLFWEDTAHARLPSFGLCLEEMTARSLPFRGIGTFDPQGSKRSDAEAIILREYPKSLLFALRPISDAHYSGPPRPVFDPPSPGFPLDYDSSWKDNLVFIYTGTRVFPLLSVQTDMESITSWISNGRERYPFGAWFRRLLRARAGLDPGDPADPTDFAYASWANLL